MDNIMRLFNSVNLVENDYFMYVYMNSFLSNCTSTGSICNQTCAALIIYNNWGFFVGFYNCLLYLTSSTDIQLTN